eukprot:862219-Ditylum_brightwellii.AAC.1
MANDIKDLKSKEIISFYDKKCYINEEEGAVPLHVYTLNFELLQKEQQKDKTFLEALKKSKTKYGIKFFQGWIKQKPNLPR